MEGEGPATDLSRLPQVDAVIRHPAAGPVIERAGRRRFVTAVRGILDRIRETAVTEPVPIPSVPEVVDRADRWLREERAARLQPVLNATGVILHTNLGRAPLSAAAVAAVTDAAGYTNLEYDLGSGSRGSRTAAVGRLAAELCGTEAATVVNNGAAGLLLVLAALATGREVIVSRGELIEIGGSYRLPDLVPVSGARLREVGTTNRTRVEDYRAALGPDTGLLLKVHPSNYRIEGFAEDTPAAALAELARDAGVPFVYDLGSGLLGEAPDLLAAEPSVENAVADGADLLVFSGDKLLGGPQAGVVAGRRDLVERCRNHPLARAVRIDKLQRAALEATLDAHLRGGTPHGVPVWDMLSADLDDLRARAERLAEELGEAARAEPHPGVVGGGTLPGLELPSWCVALAAPSPDDLAARLRGARPPVVARVEAGAVLLDLRTVPPGRDDDLAAAVRVALG